MLYVKFPALAFVKLPPGVIFKINALNVAFVTVAKLVDWPFVKALLPNLTLFNVPCDIVPCANTAVEAIENPEGAAWSATVYATEAAAAGCVTVLTAVYKYAVDAELLNPVVGICILIVLLSAAYVLAVPVVCPSVTETVAVVLLFAATVPSQSTSGELPSTSVTTPAAFTLILPVQSETWNNPSAGVVTCIGPCIFVPAELVAKAHT